MDAYATNEGGKVLPALDMLARRNRGGFISSLEILQTNLSPASMFLGLVHSVLVAGAFSEQKFFYSLMCRLDSRFDINRYQISTYRACGFPKFMESFANV